MSQVWALINPFVLTYGQELADIKQALPRAWPLGHARAPVLPLVGWPSVHTPLAFQLLGNFSDLAERAFFETEMCASCLDVENGAHAERLFNASTGGELPSVVVEVVDQRSCL